MVNSKLQTLGGQCIHLIEGVLCAALGYLPPEMGRACPFQFQRAKGRVDVELHEDLLSLHSKSNDAAIDLAVLRKLVEKLQLTGIYDLIQESCPLHDMVTSIDEDPEERIDKMSLILRKIKGFVLTDTPGIGSSSREKSSTCSGQASIKATYKAPVIPDDFLCYHMGSVENDASVDI